MTEQVHFMLLLTDLVQPALRGEDGDVAVEPRTGTPRHDAALTAAG